MDLELLKRRAEMLDTVCKGFHLSAVISQLAEKYHVSEKALWNDWERREKWVPFLLALEKYGGFAEVMESKINAVQKAAWGISARADNDSAKVGALKVVLDSLEVQSNIVISREIESRLEHLEEVVKKKLSGNEQN